MHTWCISSASSAAPWNSSARSTPCTCASSSRQRCSSDTLSKVSTKASMAMRASPSETIDLARDRVQRLAGKLWRRGRLHALSHWPCSLRGGKRPLPPGSGVGMRWVAPACASGSRKPATDLRSARRQLRQFGDGVGSVAGGIRSLRGDLAQHLHVPGYGLRGLRLAARAGGNVLHQRGDLVRHLLDLLQRTGGVLGQCGATRPRPQWSAPSTPRRRWYRSGWCAPAHRSAWSPHRRVPPGAALHRPPPRSHDPPRRPWKPGWRHSTPGCSSARRGH